MNVVDKHHCGTAVLLGRPNVGKSTLLNAMLDCHLSIVSPKPQTTRHRILGIVNRPQGQILFLDTPGLHGGHVKALNRRLNRAVHGAVAEADVLLHMVVAGQWREEDEAVYRALQAHATARVLVVNKVDMERDKRKLLPWIQEVTQSHDYADVAFVSARKRDGLEGLEKQIIAHLPVGPPRFDADDMTDRSERFLVAELVREQLMLRLAQELPYATTVQIERFEDAEDGSSDIDAVIWVERAGQKGIVIGKGGRVLKAVGSNARRRIEDLLGRHVRLGLWVKVREGWSDDDAALERFGIE